MKRILMKQLQKQRLSNNNQINQGKIMLRYINDMQIKFNKYQQSDIQAFNSRFIIFIIYIIMARTKQTARVSYAGKGGKGGKGVSNAIFPAQAYISTNAMVEIEEAEQIQKPELDTNQFSIKFDDQLECEKQAVEGKFFRCEECQSILTIQSKVYSNKQYEELKVSDTNSRMQEERSDEIRQKYLNTKENVWICEFCCNHNIIPIQFQLIKSDNPCYLIQKKNIDIEEQVEQNQDQMIIFCIDISGSMEMEVGGGRKSRLDCLKEAIVDELKKMKVERSKKKVGLITFGSEVYLIGDGVSKQVRLPQKCFHNFEKIIQQSSKHRKTFSESINKAYEKLIGILKQTICHGGTALGPALVSAIQIASTGAIGSKVIICTDGEANEGIGSNYDEKFYEKLSEYAKQKRVSVSVLTIKGDNCNIKLLGKVSLATEGQILKVDPTKLGTEFSKILNDDILGSSAEIQIRLNRRFRFRDVSKKLSDNGSVLKQAYGNFNKDSEITFQFDLISAEQAKEIKSIHPDLYKIKKLPMQIQITYVSKNGNKYLQVYTDWRIITEDISELFVDANFGVFAANILQKLSTLIKDQNFDAGKQIIANYRKICQQKFSKFAENQQKIKKFNQRVLKLQKVLDSKHRKKNYAKGLPCQDDDQQQSQSYSESESDNQAFKRKMKRSRSRSRDKIRNKSKERDRKKQKSDKKKSKKQKKQVMDSDSEEEILYKERKARSRSRSRSRSPPRQKQKQKELKKQVQIQISKASKTRSKNK